MCTHLVGFPNKFGTRRVHFQKCTKHGRIILADTVVSQKHVNLYFLKFFLNQTIRNFCVDSVHRLSVPREASNGRTLMFHYLHRGCCLDMFSSHSTLNYPGAGAHFSMAIHPHIDTT